MRYNKNESHVFLKHKLFFIFRGNFFIYPWF